MCSGSVCAANTSARGASKVRVATTEVAVGVVNVVVCVLVVIVDSVDQANDGSIAASRSWLTRAPSVMPVASTMSRTSSEA